MSILALQLLVAAPPAQAESCSFNSATGVATATMDGFPLPATVTRTAGGDLTFAGISCGTVTTVIRMTIDMGGDGSLVFSLANGPLAPGAGDEPGDTEEIEFEVTNPPSEITVIGTDANDVFTLGSRLLRPDFVLVQTINMNGHLEGSSPDDDVIVRGIPGRVWLDGKAGSDTLRADGTGVLFSDPTHANVIFGDGSGSDSMVGGYGADMQIAELTPDPGDSFAGGPGVDSLSMPLDRADTEITLNGAADDGTGCPGPSCEGDNIASDVERILTGRGNDHLVGGPGADFLDAGPGSNTVEGGLGNDVLTAGTGTDSFLGGPGFDMVSYADHQDGVFVTLDGIDDDGRLGEDDRIGSDVEGAIGSRFADDTLSGNAGPNRLFGNGGNDDLFGQGGDDLLGGGDPFAPALHFDGSDAFFGGSGIDTVTEANHSGNQSLSIDGVPNDMVVGDPSQGRDNIYTDVENVIGGPGNDTIRGDGLRNTLTGGPGNDTLIGLGENDILIPNSGRDDLQGGTGADDASYATSGQPVIVHLGQGTATGQGADELYDIERATGSPHDDRLTGSSEPNILIGGAGDDVLSGLAANDRLFGQAGDDTFNGGPGTDLCNQSGGTGSMTGCEG